MPQVETLHDALIDELKDLYNAEKQLTKALPKMATNATSRRLRDALTNHLKETKTQDSSARTSHALTRRKASRKAV